MHTSTSILDRVAQAPNISPAFAAVLKAVGTEQPHPRAVALMSHVAALFWRDGDDLQRVVDIGAVLGMNSTQVYEVLREFKEARDAAAAANEPIVKLGQGDYTRNYRG